METPGVSNPIERRFMQAHDDWLTFAGNKKRNYYYGKRMKPMNLCLKPIFRCRKRMPVRLFNLMMFLKRQSNLLMR